MKLWENFKTTKLYIGTAKLIDVLKPMTWKQRLDHLWTYYKIYLVVVVFAVMAIGFVGSLINQQLKDPLISGMMVNLTMKQEGYDYLYTDYQNELAPGDKRKTVEFDYTVFGDMKNPENGESSYYASMILVARVSEKMLDYMLLDKFAMEHYLGQDVYLDLREFFTEDELAELAAANRLIYLQLEIDGEKSGEPYPVAVDISSIPFVKDTVTSEGPTYFALSGHVRNLEMCRHVWDRLHAWKGLEKQ